METVIVKEQEAVARILAHHGVLGQKWGVRRAQVREYAQAHPKTVKAAKIGGTVALAAGTVAVAAILYKKGGSHLATSATTAVGKKAVESLTSHSNKAILQGMAKHGKSPSVASMHALAKVLKPDEFIIWDHVTNAYKVSKTAGYNPNTGVAKLAPEILKMRY